MRKLRTQEGMGLINGRAEVLSDNRSCCLSNTQSWLVHRHWFPISLKDLAPRQSLPSRGSLGGSKLPCCSKFKQERACSKPFVQWTYGPYYPSPSQQPQPGQAHPSLDHHTSFGLFLRLVHVSNTTPPLITCLGLSRPDSHLILQMRKLRPREVAWFSHGHRWVSVREESGIQGSKSNALSNFTDFLDPEETGWDESAGTPSGSKERTFWPEGLLSPEHVVRQ